MRADQQNKDVFGIFTNNNGALLALAYFLLGVKGFRKHFLVR